MFRRLAIAAVLLATAALADAPPGQPAAADDDLPTAGLSATVRADRPVTTQPQSVGVLTRDDVRRNEGVFLDDTLNLIPGVRLESRTVSGGQRITIRGYGNGTNFNGTGYKAYLNGIPLTDAEGTTFLDDLDVSMLGRVEVIKGPASSLYGTGIGGVVRFSTLAPEPRKAQLTQEVIGGTPGLFRSNTRVESATDDSSFLANYGHQHSDGYRTHSLSNKDFALATAEYRPSSRQGISFLASYNHSFEQLAGQLTEAQYNARLNYAEPPYLANNGHVAIDSVRFGVAHKIQFLPSLANTTSAFASGYQLNQPFAVGLSDTLAINVGARTEFSGRIDGGAVSLLATAGSEIERTTAFKKSYGLTNGVAGAIRGDLQVISLQSNTFAQATAFLPAGFSVTGGASLNLVRYRIEDRLTNSANPGHLDQSGRKVFDPVVTPRLAVQKTFAGDHSAYAQVSQGYSAPGSGSVVIPQIGAVNKDLRAERGTLFEVGAKGSLTDERVAYEVAVFDLRVQDKLTPQAVTNSSGTVLYTVTTNAGSQNDVGLEAAARVGILKGGSGPVPLLQAFGAYTYSRFRYDGFKSDNNGNARTVSYDGNKVVGVPDHVFDVGVDAVSRWGVYGNTTLQVVRPTPLTYDNTQRASGYSLLNAKLGYRAALPEGFKLDLSFGVKNIADSTYFTMVFLNANYSGPAPAVYLPGPGRTVFGGVSLSKAL
ncbi:MAG: TonB-dependent receptor [Myxococcales bacterium]